MAWAVNRPPAGTAYSLPTRLFPADNWWNLRVDTAPLDPLSDHYVLGTPASFPVDPNDYNYRGYGVGPNYTSRLRMDWGMNAGFPFCTVSGDYPKVYFSHISYSGGASGDDTRGYPIPVEALTVPGWTEDLLGTINEPLSAGDRHLLIFDVDNQHLYEIYQPRHNATGSPITVNPGDPDYEFQLLPGEYSCASCSWWDTTTNNMRPLTVTSSDAAGLQVLPGLIQYDELWGPNPIQHALRTYVAWASYEQPHYVYPATHEAGNYLRGMPPLGARFRLKASFDMSVFADPYYDRFRKIAQALKDYGTIITDNGGHGMISGCNDARWGAWDAGPQYEYVYGFQQIRCADFELVELGWNPVGVSPQQYARPVIDIRSGTWTASTGTDLYAMVDEPTVSDADYITSGPTPVAGVDDAKLALDEIGVPATGTVTLRIRGQWVP